MGAVWLVSLSIFPSQCKASQYEMMLDVAVPEPPALICRFPEELDLLM